MNIPVSERVNPIGKEDIDSMMDYGDKLSYSKDHKNSPEKIAKRDAFKKDYLANIKKMEESKEYKEKELKVKEKYNLTDLKMPEGFKFEGYEKHLDAIRPNRKTGKKGRPDEDITDVNDVKYTIADIRLEFERAVSDLAYVNAESRKLSKNENIAEDVVGRLTYSKDTWKDISNPAASLKQIKEDANKFDYEDEFFHHLKDITPRYPFSYGDQIDPSINNNIKSSIDGSGLKDTWKKVGSSYGANINPMVGKEDARSIASQIELRQEQKDEYDKNDPKSSSLIKYPQRNPLEDINLRKRDDILRLYLAGDKNFESPIGGEDFNVSEQAVNYLEGNLKENSLRHRINLENSKEFEKKYLPVYDEESGLLKAGQFVVPNKNKFNGAGFKLPSIDGKTYTNQQESDILIDLIKQAREQKKQALAQNIENIKKKVNAQIEAESSLTKGIPLKGVDAKLAKTNQNLYARIANPRLPDDKLPFPVQGFNGEFTPKAEEDDVFRPTIAMQEAKAKENEIFNAGAEQRKKDKESERINLQERMLAEGMRHTNPKDLEKLEFFGSENVPATNDYRKILGPLNESNAPEARRLMDIKKKQIRNGDTDSIAQRLHTQIAKTIAYQKNPNSDIDDPEVYSPFLRAVNISKLGEVKTLSSASLKEYESKQIPVLNPAIMALQEYYDSVTARRYNFEEPEIVYKKDLDLAAKMDREAVMLIARKARGEIKVNEPLGEIDFKSIAIQDFLERRKKEEEAAKNTSTIKNQSGQVINVTRKHTGGPVAYRSFGGAVDAMLTPGEMVISPEKAAENEGVLRHINNGGDVKNFNFGGRVSRGRSFRVPAYAPNPDPERFEKVGSDSVAAPGLAAGSFVVNARDTAKNLPFLQHLASGGSVGYYAEGAKLQKNDFNLLGYPTDENLDFSKARTALMTRVYGNERLKEALKEYSKDKGGIESVLEEIVSEHFHKNKIGRIGAVRNRQTALYDAIMPGYNNIDPANFKSFLSGNALENTEKQYRDLVNKKSDKDLQNLPALNDELNSPFKRSSISSKNPTINLPNGKISKKGPIEEELIRMERNIRNAKTILPELENSKKGPNQEDLLVMEQNAIETKNFQAGRNETSKKGPTEEELARMERNAKEQKQSKEENNRTYKVGPTRRESIIMEQNAEKNKQIQRLKSPEMQEKEKLDKETRRLNRESNRTEIANLRIKLSQLKQDPFNPKVNAEYDRVSALIEKKEKEYRDMIGYPLKKEDFNLLPQAPGFSNGGTVGYYEDGGITNPAIGNFSSIGKKPQEKNNGFDVNSFMQKAVEEQKAKEEEELKKRIKDKKEEMIDNKQRIMALNKNRANQKLNKKDSVFLKENEEADSDALGWFDKMMLAGGIGKSLVSGGISLLGNHAIPQVGKHVAKESLTEAGSYLGMMGFEQSTHAVVDTFAKNKKDTPSYASNYANGGAVGYFEDGGFSNFKRFEGYGSSSGLSTLTTPIVNEAVKNQYKPKMSGVGNNDQSFRNNSSASSDINTKNGLEMALDFGADESSSKDLKKIIEDLLTKQDFSKKMRTSSLKGYANGGAVGYYAAGDVVTESDAGAAQAEKRRMEEAIKRQEEIRKIIRRKNNEGSEGVIGGIRRNEMEILKGKKKPPDGKPDNRLVNELSMEELHNVINELAGDKLDVLGADKLQRARQEFANRVKKIQFNERYTQLNNALNSQKRGGKKDHTKQGEQFESFLTNNGIKGQAHTDRPFRLRDNADIDKSYLTGIAHFEPNILSKLNDKKIETMAMNLIKKQKIKGFSGETANFNEANYFGEIGDAFNSKHTFLKMSDVTKITDLLDRQDKGRETNLNSAALGQRIKSKNPLDGLDFMLEYGQQDPERKPDDPFRTHSVLTAQVSNINPDLKPDGRVNFKRNGVALLEEDLLKGRVGQEIDLTRLKKPVKKAFGGYINGASDGDTVPALLSAGEFVMPRHAVNRIGLDNLEKMRKPQRFFDGGAVGSPRASVFDKMNNVANSQSANSMDVDSLNNAAREFNKAAKSFETSMAKMEKSVNKLEGTMDKLSKVNIPDNITGNITVNNQATVTIDSPNFAMDVQTAVGKAVSDISRKLNDATDGKVDIRNA